MPHQKSLCVPINLQRAHMYGDWVLGHQPITVLCNIESPEVMIHLFPPPRKCNLMPFNNSTQYCDHAQGNAKDLDP
jgi:hypothetical protein